MEVDPQLRTRVNHRVGFGQALAFGIGNIPGTILGYGILNGGLLFPVFSIALGVSPALVGLAAGLSRAIDFFTDPLAGYLSDAYRHRFGRRSVVAAGCLFGGLCSASLWLFPRHLTPLAYFIWLLLFSFAILIGWSVVSVPYQALGYEMAEDTDERTKLMAYATFMGTVAGTIFNWAYAATQLRIFGDTANGARWVGCTMALGVIGFGLLFFLCCKGGARTTTAPPKAGDRPPGAIDFIVSARRVLKSRPMRFLVGTLFINNLATMSTAGVSLYVLIYYVCRGDQGLASVLTGAQATIYTVTVLLCTAPIVSLARKNGKKQIMLWTMGLMWAGSGLAWICFTPAVPWLTVLCWLPLGIGNSGMGTLTISMTADACDFEELVSGHKDSGMFSAFYNWVGKLGSTVGLALSGLLGTLSNPNSGVPGHPSLMLMKGFLCIIPCVRYALALALILRYPITNEVLKGIREGLTMRRSR